MVYKEGVTTLWLYKPLFSALVRTTGTWVTTLAISQHVRVEPVVSSLHCRACDMGRQGIRLETGTVFTTLGGHLRSFKPIETWFVFV